MHLVERVANACEVRVSATVGTRDLMKTGIVGLDMSPIIIAGKTMSDMINARVVTVTTGKEITTIVIGTTETHQTTDAITTGHRTTAMIVANVDSAAEADRGRHHPEQIEGIMIGAQIAYSLYTKAEEELPLALASLARTARSQWASKRPTHCASNLVCHHSNKYCNVNHRK